MATKPAIIQQIEVQCGFPLTRLENLPEPSDAVRFQHNNSYHCDAQGVLRAINVSESEDLRSVVLTEECAGLQYLNLSENKNLAEVRFEVPLEQLIYLDLSECALEVLDFPAGFDALEKAYLQKNQLKAVDFKAACPNLLFLDISGNGLENLTLPGGFEALAYLYLNDNQLRQVVFEQPIPYELEILHLRNNQLQALPGKFLYLKKLQTLYLHNNPLPKIPKDVISGEERGNSIEEVRRYLQAMQEEKGVNLFQAKMILVGNGEVGKSSIRIKLLDPAAPLPKKHERTPGLDIARFTIEKLKPSFTGLQEEIDFHLNIWDFGGQGKYREVQQLFCSRKSLYLFVTAHDDQPDKDDYVGFDYWFSMVNAFGYDDQEDRYSPVIHVVNKIDEAVGLVEQKTLKERFPNIQHFVDISCLTLRNFDNLEAAICNALREVSPDVFTASYPESWMGVKAELEGIQQQNHITYEDYLAVAARHGLEKGNADTWLRILDRIGTVIYFGENPDLNTWIILNPTWVKDAMYKVLDSPQIRNGLLYPSLFSVIWQGYSPEEQQKLVALMMAYKLGYRQQDSFGKDEYIVPALLSDERPVLPPYLQNPDFQLKIVWRPFIPAGTVNKLIVTLQRGGMNIHAGLETKGEHLKGMGHVQAKVYNNLIWKNNVIVHDPENNAYAHVEEDWENKTVYVNLFRKDAAPLFDYLLGVFESINQTLKSTKYLSQLSTEAFCWRKEKWRNLEDLKDDGINFFKEEKQTTDANPAKVLIAQARLKEALTTLAATVSAPFYNEVVQLQGRLNKLESEERRGIISFDNAKLERAQIADAALALCDLAE